MRSSVVPEDDRPWSSRSPGPEWRSSIEWYANKHGTAKGYLLRHPADPAKTFPYYYLSNQWQRIKRAGEVDVPDGMVMYGFRHFLASNCLANRIPITDVAEWMGHRSIDA
ncbi:hypothetical protein [Streptomyces sp. 150FB]|uniref:hypothetical protein n=1 Tax=Streptomyces sp. 150FB TaxID=1576605 RepID=UPI001F31B25C|nr:hypothetical protein [Streptomyces sp. 150FB]